MEAIPHAYIAYQIVAITIAITITAQTTGVTFLLLPLRGDALAA